MIQAVKPQILVLLAVVLGVGCGGMGGIGYNPNNGLPPGRCANPNDPTTSEACPTSVVTGGAVTSAPPSCTDPRFDDTDRCCKAGHGEDCFARAEGFKGPQVYASDSSRVMRLDYLRLGCERNHLLSCATYGEELVADKQRERAIPFLQKACEGALLDACRRLDGLGAQRSTDPKKATATVKAECDGGSGRACLTFAGLLTRGTGIAPDPAAAFALQETTCSGKPRASREPLSSTIRIECLAFLARAYRVGDGVPQNAARAASLFQEACDAGDYTDSCLVVAESCRADLEAHQMGNRAGACYDAACDKGDVPDACLRKGRLLLANKSGAADVRAAGAAFGQACKKGLSEGCEGVQKAKTELSRLANLALPSLFTKCEQNKAAIEQWRVAGMQAAARRDQAGAAQAAMKMQEIQPSWSQTLDDLQEVIGIVTGGDGPRYDQLILDVQRRCSCDATPSGYCRR